ncbi:MAG: hypothetical protein P4M12_13105 [Gammaproteobacteria bacterium]|nr:hypothetical protein [Gammaproteobacteria bacterium]
MSDTRRFEPKYNNPEDNNALQLGITVPSQQEGEIRIISSTSASKQLTPIRKNSTPDISTPATPGGTKKTIPMQGVQGFMLAFHRADTMHLKAIDKIRSNIIGTPHIAYDFNSSDFTLALMDKSEGYKEFVKSVNKNTLVGYLPLGQLGLYRNINIVEEILEQVRVFISKHNVNEINYLGDFNAGQSSHDFSHIPELIKRLESEIFLSQDQTKVKVKFDVGNSSVSSFAKAKTSGEDSARSSSGFPEVIFRCFLEGGGGTGIGIGDVVPATIYTKMNPVAAFNEFNYNSLAPMTAANMFGVLLAAQSVKLRSASSTPPMASGTPTAVTPSNLPRHPIGASSVTINALFQLPSACLSANAQENDVPPSSSMLPVQVVAADIPTPIQGSVLEQLSLPASAFITPVSSMTGPHRFFEWPDDSEKFPKVPHPSPEVLRASSEETTIHRSSSDVSLNVRIFSNARLLSLGSRTSSGSSVVDVAQLNQLSTTPNKASSGK